LGAGPRVLLRQQRKAIGHGDSSMDAMKKAQARVQGREFWFVSEDKQ